jgi:hypothetical protein
MYAFFGSPARLLRYRSCIGIRLNKSLGHAIFSRACETIGGDKGCRFISKRSAFFLLILGRISDHRGTLIRPIVCMGYCCIRDRSIIQGQTFQFGSCQTAEGGWKVKGSAVLGSPGWDHPNGIYTVKTIATEIQSVRGTENVCLLERRHLQSLQFLQ